MKHPVSCNIIQDLMPLYVEELTSELSNSEINNHLDNCKECRKKYHSMKFSMDEKKPEENETEKPEIDYLKKIKVYQKRNLILGSIISFLFGMTLPLLIIAIPIIIHGGAINSYQIARLHAVWYQLLINLLLSGFIVCMLYMAINLLFRKLKMR